MAESFEELGEREFVVVEISKTEPPDGETQGNWYRYTIGHGSSPITGVRAGSQKSVRQYAEEFAENLNRRALLGHSSYSTRKPAKK